MADDIQYNLNVGRDRFEIYVGEELAGVIDYTDEDGILDLYHTGIEPEFGGRGLGTKLVEYALSDCQDAEVKIRPTCPFISKYIDAHPEYQDLVA